MKLLPRPLVASALAVLLVGVLPLAAQATPATLKRSVENITLFPLDVLASPVVAGRTIVRNLQDIEDSPGVRIAYPIPGYVWLTGVQIGAGVLRGVTGLFEFVPGLGLLFFDADLEPLFDPAAENEAMVDVETPVYHMRFGIDYTTSSF